MIVRWTKLAASDLTYICDYTKAQFGPMQSRRMAMAIFALADSLQEMPVRGRSGRKPGTREITVAGSPFVIISTVGKATVALVRILHGSEQGP